jgi:hypothetical protein
VLAAFAATVILGVAAVADHAVAAASGFVEQVPVREDRAPAAAAT